MRQILERAVERAIEALDAFDGDPDLEEQCEDEGAQCEDEGIRESDVGVDYENGDQTRPIHASGVHDVPRGTLVLGRAV